MPFTGILYLLVLVFVQSCPARFCKRCDGLLEAIPCRRKKAGKCQFSSTNKAFRKRNSRGQFPKDSFLRKDKCNYHKKQIRRTPALHIFEAFLHGHFYVLSFYGSFQVSMNCRCYIATNSLIFQIFSGVAVFVFNYVTWSAFGYYFSAFVPSFGTQINQPVCIFNQIQVVLNNQNCISFFY